MLKHASRLVPLSQEHLVIKFCQLVHHLLNQLKVKTILNRRLFLRVYTCTDHDSIQYVNVLCFLSLRFSLSVLNAA